MQLLSPQIMKLLMEFVQTSTDDDTNNDPETWHGMSMVLRNAMKRPMGNAFHTYLIRKFQKFEEIKVQRVIFRAELE